MKNHLSKEYRKLLSLLSTELIDYEWCKNGESAENVVSFLFLETDRIRIIVYRFSYEALFKKNHWY
jgi:hypothetical protein